jgi:hypothetical protein
MSLFEIIANGHAVNQAPRLVILIWPSTGGNARSYRIKESELVSEKILLLRYNPTSHGNATGDYDPQTSIHHLLTYLKDNQLNEVPVIGIGHSGGGAALVMMDKQIRFVKRYLLSPILDSRLSLEFLYDEGNIHEFLELLVSDASEQLPEALRLERKQKVYHRLSQNAWLYSGEVADLAFPVSNKRIHLNDLTQFLRNLFLPGFKITKQLLNISSPIEIFLPTEDKWFPRSKTFEFQKAHGIEVTEITSAKDHFFNTAWLSVWQKIKSEIYT